MFKNSIALLSSIDLTKKLEADIKRLRQVSVYVGIPEGKSPRHEGEGTVNNAQLLYIHTYGSPRHNIPPRPVIEPAIEANKDKIIAELKLAGRSVLDGRYTAAANHYKRAGQIGKNEAQWWFKDPRNGWPPLAKSTIASRRSRGRPKPYLTLIDTWQMYRAIDYMFYEGDLRG